MSTAKTIRLGKILNAKSKRGIIVPIDHGLTLGPIPGLESLEQMRGWLQNENIDAILAHKGMIHRLAACDLLQDRGIILHLNGMNTLAKSPDNKEMLTSLEAAAKLGVDAVSLQINFTGENDAENWKMLSQTIDDAQDFGFPVLTMLYDKVVGPTAKASLQRFRQLLRVAMELGTDAIKIAMPESEEFLAGALAPISKDVLIFLAGGEPESLGRLLQRIELATAWGAAGICMGRNVFSKPDAGSTLRKLAVAVHRNPVVLPKTHEYAHAF